MQEENYRAYVKLLQSNEAALRCFIRSLMPSWNDVDDVMQEVSLVLWEKFEDFDQNTNFLKWAYVIARFKVMNFCSKKGREKLHFYNEATLVPPEGENVYYNIRIDGVSTPKTWTIPSRSACMECHTPSGGFALSFNTRQLNRIYNSFGSNENIISALHSQGYLDVNPGSPASLPKHFAENDSSATLQQKARSYLDVNCAYCHQEGGPTPAEFDARALLTNIQTGMINGVPLNNGGDSTRYWKGKRFIIDWNWLLSRTRKPAGI